MRFYKSKPSPSDAPPTSLTSEINCYNISTMSIPKLILEHHSEQISSLQFTNTHNSDFNILFSGSYDKSIIIWKISQKTFTGEKIRLIQYKSRISSFVLYPNDQYLLVGCFDHSIYITKCNYDSNSFDIVATFNKHDNIINSIALDPFIEQTGRFVSLSDKGRLIITSFDTSSDKLNIIHNYEEFVNNSHKCLITQKQIDWSVDGKWIVSVDHHQIKRQNILHARLINVNDVPSSQILIGHESPVLTAKFSKCWYSENSANSSDEFQLCATSDRNGNLIIWKVVKESFNVLVEVNNYSESNITSMIWSHNGEYLITVNSSGSVCAIELNEFKIKVVNNNNNKSNVMYQQGLNDKSQQTSQIKQPKKTIVPILISSPPSFYDNNTNTNNNNNAPLSNDVNNHSQCNINPTITNGNTALIVNQQQQQPCSQCQRRLYQIPEHQIHEIHIPSLITRDKGKVSLYYENQPYNNYSIIKLQYTFSQTSIESNTLFQSKHLNKMIKLFTANNFFYAFYDTNFTLNIYSLLNTMLISHMYIEEVSLLTSYTKYLLLLTSQNRIIIINVFTKEKEFDDYLNINAASNSVYHTKIDEIYFINLMTIVIKAETFNPYKNTTNKMLLYFHPRNRHLILSNNTQLTYDETYQMRNNIEMSFYNSYFEKKIYYKDGEGKVMLDDNDYFTLSSNVDMIYEGIMKGKYFNNKSECMRNYNELLKLIIEHPKYETFAYVVDDFINLYMNDEDKEYIERVYKEFMNTKQQKEQMLLMNNNNSSNIHLQHNVLTSPLQQPSTTPALIPERHSSIKQQQQQQCFNNIIDNQNMFDDNIEHELNVEIQVDNNCMNDDNNNNHHDHHMELNNVVDGERDNDNDNVIENVHNNEEDDILNVNIPESNCIADDKIIEDKIQLDDLLNSGSNGIQLDDDNGKEINVLDDVIENEIESEKNIENEVIVDDDNQMQPQNEINMDDNDNNNNINNNINPNNNIDHPVNQ